jgi:hypothetical protein
VGEGSQVDCWRVRVSRVMGRVSPTCFRLPSLMMLSNVANASKLMGAWRLQESKQLPSFSRAITRIGVSWSASCPLLRSGYGAWRVARGACGGDSNFCTQ